MARPGALIVGCSGFQLRHAALSVDIQLDMLVENVM